MLTDEQRAAGWIEHDGGPCPVAGDTWVSVKFRGDPDPTKGVLRTHGVASRMAWWHDGQEDDIIAYLPNSHHD